MFAHPRCPCTRSSLALLHRLALHAPIGTTVEVAFYRPANEPDDWARTQSWDLAAQIPGIHLRIDPDGLEARAAGGLTSGHVVIHDPRGHPVFSGGLTESRSNSAPGASFDRAVAAMQGSGAPELRQGDNVGDGTPVFGCPIQGATSALEDAP